ncbi:MAG TPA: UTRA domain-containing protein [Streptosporangiaceae bacterium]|nr:UTRA domain-containing protein [Streptosporangiaceae bacterium]
MPGTRSAAHVLADRLAVALVRHEPGWRLPRQSVLARRYDVSPAQIDAAISELIGRHLLRRLPDGKVHRVSAAEYLISLNGVPGLRSHIDPMAGELTCRSRRTAWRRVPGDVGSALQLDPDEQVCVVHAVWAAAGEAAASAITYVPAGRAGRLADAELARAGWSDLASAGEPVAVHVEMQPPPPSVARILRLSAGQPAALVTVRFDDPATGRPAALTLAALRPELFRIVIHTAELPLPGGDERGLPGAWAAADWGSLPQVRPGEGSLLPGPRQPPARAPRRSGGFDHARATTAVPA